MIRSVTYWVYQGPPNFSKLPGRVAPTSMMFADSHDSALLKYATVLPKSTSAGKKGVGLQRLRIYLEAPRKYLLKRPSP